MSKKVKCPCCNGTGELDPPQVKHMLTEDKALVTAKALRDIGYTIRGIADILGYRHPGSVSHLLKKSKID